MSKYVVFDGMDGSGKGTQIKLLEEKYGPSVIFTREPGGTPFAEEIRKLVRDNPLAGESTVLNNFLLFWAAREDLQHKLVAPSLHAGKHVFSDRGDSSTFAFQICGEEHPELLPLFRQLRRDVFRHEPDLYVVFDLPAETARARVMGDTARDTNHFDERDLGYYERVRAGFHSFANEAPVVFIDASGTPETVAKSVMECLQKAGVE